MPLKPLRVCAAILIAASCLTSTKPALADATDECIGESEAGQKLLFARRFVESRPHLIACGRAQCPAMVIRDCAERLRQAEASAASVVLSARLPDGSEAPDVSVFVDESRGATRPTGEALSIDPGPHRFRFEGPGGAEVVQQVTVPEGARLQSVTATFAPAREAAAASSSHPRKTAGVAVGAAGLAGVVTGGVLVGVATSSASSEKQACATSHCGQTQYNAALGDYHSAIGAATASTVAFAAGGVLLATGVALWLSAPKGVTGTTSTLSGGSSYGPHGPGPSRPATYGRSMADSRWTRSSIGQGLAAVPTSRPVWADST